MTGDPAFDPWPLLEQVDDPFAHPDPHRVLTRRTAMVADELGEDTARVRAWPWPGTSSTSCGPSTRTRTSPAASA